MYTTSDKVALLTKNLLKGATDFNKETVVDKTRVDQLISWVTATIDMKFSQAGFKIPLTLTGETFPTHQTTYLEFLCSLGVAAMLNPVVTPNRSSRSPEKGPLEAIYDDEIKRIYDNGIHHLKFRADYYYGTAAEKALTDDIGPKSDWSEGYIDPTKYMNLDQYTRLMERVKNSFVNPEWDYLRALQDNGLNPIWI